MTIDSSTRRAHWLRFGKTSLCASVLMFALSGCGGAPESGESTSSGEQEQFFRNSVRRDPTEEEARLVVYLGGCTAFFVDNTAGKTFLVTARHCVDYSITNWCNGGGELEDNQGQRGSCKRVVAADVDHDVAIFEAEFPYTPPAGSVLRLASYAPRVNTRLKMIGYPFDFDPQTARKGRLTTTENCWILKRDVNSPYDDIKDHSSLHNCTTYGGNSGGPMFIEGTLDVVGLPFTYVPDDYSRRSPTRLSTAAVMAQTADIVGRFRDELLAEGIVISDRQP